MPFQDILKLSIDRQRDGAGQRQADDAICLVRLGLEPSTEGFDVLLAIKANIVDNESPRRNSTRTDCALAVRAEFNNEHVARIDLVICGRLVTARVVDTTARAERRRRMAIPKSEVADPLVGDRCFRLVDINRSRPSAIELVSDRAMGDEYSGNPGAWIQPGHNRFNRIMKRLLRHPRRSNDFNAGYRGARH